MEPYYILHVNESHDQSQTERDISFIGGFPRLPASFELPVCKLCGSEQTFFFQIAFPAHHLWYGLTMALFACTSCAHENFLIPQMLQGPLAQADIPEGFLTDYQTNFRILVFPTEHGQMRSDYQPKVRYKDFQFVLEDTAEIVTHKLGGAPDWFLDDESPATYKKTIPMVFLFQILEDTVYEILDDAPPQIRLGLTRQPEPSPHRYYRLFLANNLYFFGTKNCKEPLVYILTQI